MFWTKSVMGNRGTLRRLCIVSIASRELISERSAVGFAEKGARAEYTSVAVVPTRPEVLL